MVFLRNGIFSAFIVLATCGWVEGQPLFPSLFPEDAPEAQEETAEETKAREADKAYQAGNFNKVLQLTNELLETNPDMVIALHLRANARLELGKKSRNAAQVRLAIEDSRRALALEGKKYVWLNIPYLYGMTTLSELEKKPGHARAAHDAIRPLLARTDLKDDERAQLNFQLALANLALGRPVEAINDFQATLKIAPRHMQACVKLAQTQAAANDIPGALATLDRAVEMLPQSPIVFNERGMLRRKTGNIDGAIEDFTTVLNLDPQATPALINRGVALMEIDSPEAAEADFSAALLAQPGTTNLRHLRGTARLVQGKLDGAIGDYTAAMKALPMDVLPVQDRGFARLFKGDCAGAAEDFAQALKLAPSFMHLTLWRSVALTRAGQAEAGKKILDDFARRPSAERGWLDTVAGYLTGKIDEEAFLKETFADNGQPVPNLLCEANFFIGQKKLMSDDAAGAREAFEKAVATNRHGLAAHRGARLALQSQ